MRIVSCLRGLLGAAAFEFADATDQIVECRIEEDVGECGEQHAARQGHAHDVPCRGVDARSEYERHHTENEGERRHDDGPHALPGGTYGCFGQRGAFLSENPVGVFDDQNCVFRRQPDQHDDRNLHVDVVDVECVRQVHPARGEQCSQNGDRNAQQDGHRQPPRFIQCGQCQKDEDQCQQIDRAPRLRGLCLLIRDAAPSRSYVFGQDFGRRAFDRIHDGCGRGSRRGCDGQRNRTVEIELRDVFRTDSILHFDESRHRNAFAR